MEFLHSVFYFFNDINLEKSLLFVFMVALFAEWFVSRIKNCLTHCVRDSITNFTIGAISFGFDSVFTLLLLPLWVYLYTHAAWFSFNSWSGYSLVLLFILVDFSEYWFHRLSHRINFLWSAHVVHHQSECFNLTVGLRTSLFVPLFNVFIYSLFPWLGFDPHAVLLIIFIQGIYQLLVHTELVGKLGVLDYLIVTPSVHRVHHGKNEVYIDKNYGKFLLIWDQLFGTWQQETEKPTFGITTPLKKNTAIYSVFHPMCHLLQQVKRAENKKQKRLVLFAAPEKVEEWNKQKNRGG